MPTTGVARAKRNEFPQSGNKSLAKSEGNLSKIWDLITASSSGLVEPILLKGIAFEFGFGLDDIRQVFVEMPADDVKRRLGSVRAYTPGGLSHALGDRFIHTPPESGENLEAWANRMSGADRFAFIVNHAERWNDDLCRKAARFLAPLVERIKLEEHTFEFVLFIGNYGYTPFGAHIDDHDLFVIHMHLGPGTKVMTLWDPAEYQALTGSTRSNFQPEQLVDRGKSYRIEAGDLFLLPPGYFHVGSTPEFSGDIAIAVSRVPAESMLKLALESAVPSLIALNSAKRPSSADEWLRSVGKSTHSKVKDWARTSLDRYRAARISRGGFTSEPMDRTIPSDRLRTSSVRITDPFRLLFRRDGDLLWGYARGHEVRWPTHPTIERLLNRLNTGEVISVPALLRQLSEEIEDEAVLDILCLLYQYRGIELAN
jgi:Cupin superfamily protein